MKNEKAAGIVIFYLDEKEPIFLLLKYPTYWGFVKGIIEENEEPKEAAIREAGEETGLTGLKIIEGFHYNQKWFRKFKGELINKEAIYFISEVTKQEAEKTKISFEHEDFEWLPYNEALKKIKVKNNKEMLDKAYEFARNIGKQKKLF